MSEKKAKSKKLTWLLACIGLCCLVISLITSALSLAHMKKISFTINVKSDPEIEAVQAIPNKK